MMRTVPITSGKKEKVHRVVKTFTDPYPSFFLFHGTEEKQSKALLFALYNNKPPGNINLLK